ncbi:hypothetical protein P170DRAFT_366440, partial [Aspergillus steynii IBT 23096]
AFSFPLAVAGPAQQLSQPLKEMIQIITFIRSTMNFSAPILMDVKSDEVYKLTYVEKAGPFPSETFRAAICALHELNTARILDQTDREAFQTTINQLDDVFATIDNGAEPVSKAFIWISESSPRFFDLLRQRHPFALVVLAHYCVVLHRLRWLWWISSWGRRILAEISGTLENEWKPFVEWALNETALECLES